MIISLQVIPDLKKILIFFLLYYFTLHII